MQSEIALKLLMRFSDLPVSARAATRYPEAAGNFGFLATAWRRHATARSFSLIMICANPSWV
jgi:hypothetical protein